MKLNHNVTLKQTQQLQLTPQMRQMVTLLQLSTADLEKTLEEAVQDNPLLEKAEFAESVGLSTLTAKPTNSRLHGNESADEEALSAIAEEPDLYDFLHAQVCEMTDDARQAQLLHILIESLDEHGYLEGGLNEVIEHAPLEWALQQDELAQALTLLQHFDPAGVGAADIRESLLLQLMRLPSEDTAVCRARDIVRDHFALLPQAGNIAKLKKELNSNDYVIQSALDIIRKLNPYPGSGFASNSATVYVRPDVRVFSENGVWQVQAEAHLRPRVVICEDYAQAVRSSTDTVWKQKLNDAQMLIQNLELRENTILQVARAIVARQQDFFTFGMSALNPLQMIEIAEELDIHVSTVSRSVNQKYLICPQGLFELRLFFSNAVGGDEKEPGMSSTAIKAHLEEWICGEDKRRPLSDDALRRKLAAVNIDIARRTIAKYREELNIPSAYRRKTTG